LKPYSTTIGNAIGTEFGTSYETWDAPLNPHGTHVAGTIIAQGWNQLGVVGVIPSNQGMCLLIARTVSDAGGGTLSSDVDAAMEWCAANGARVINVSLGGSYISYTQASIVLNLEQQGILVVSAAGNDGDSRYTYPAGYPSVISVAAIASDYTRASFSNANGSVDITAPGVNILSTAPSTKLFGFNSDIVTVEASLDGFQAEYFEFSPVAKQFLLGVPANCDFGVVICADAVGKVCRNC
jgi:serine protease